MRSAAIFICVTLFGWVNMTQCSSCLPPEVKDDSVVNVITERSSTGELIRKQITVKQTLKTLRAKCRKGVLVDGKGKPIRFYHLQGCWGNPPADYLEILDAQKKEIEDLKKRFTVIEMACDSDSAPQRSIL